jgi:hypothetical protein
VPTLLRIEGFRFFFYSTERQEPPHVHVEKGDGEAKLWLQPSLPTRTDLPRASCGAHEK